MPLTVHPDTATQRTCAMTTHGSTPPKATFAKTGNTEIRCSGKLSCDCGTRIRALDIEVEELDTELDDDPGIKSTRAVCPSCGSDWFEVTL
jgi:hypothetical protein